VEAHGLLNRVDSAVFCVDAAWRNPHPAPFQLALAQLGVLPHEAIFVGDDPRWDVEGANRSNIRAVLIHSDTPPGTNCAVVRDLRAVIPLAETYETRCPGLT